MAENNGNHLETEIKSLREAMNLIFTNQFKQAEELLKQGFEAQPPAKESGDRDLRSVFALLHALLTAAQGLATFSSETIKECHGRLTLAEKKASESEEWIGKKGLKGLCLAGIGGLELVQKSYVSGLVSLTRASKYLKAISKEGINYDGPEAVIVKSASLLCLGVMNMLYSLIPQTGAGGQVVKWLAGFSGDRAKGLELLVQCYKEEGIFSPWAALVYILFQTDTRTFIGENMSPHEKETVSQMIQWAKTAYPHSVFFSVGEISLYEIEKKARKEILTISAAEDHFDLPGLKLILRHKEAVLYWTLLDFQESAIAFRASMDILMKNGRRGGVPYNAICAFLSYMQLIKEMKQQEKENKSIIKATEKTMIKIVRLFDWCYSRRARKWNKHDTETIKLLPEFVTFDPELPINLKDIPALTVSEAMGRIKTDIWILLELSMLMAFDVRCTFFMTTAKLNEFLELLMREKDERKEISVIENLKVLMLLAEIHFQQGNFEEVEKVAMEGLEAEMKGAKSPETDGFFAVFAYYKAKEAFEAKELEIAQKFLKKSESYGRKHRFSQMLLLKHMVLGQEIDAEFALNYELITLPPRAQTILNINLSDSGNASLLKGSNGELKYVLNGDGKQLDFSFELVGDGLSTASQASKSSKRSEDEENTYRGRFNLPEIGVLKLTLDNSYSLFSSKVVKLKLVPKLKIEHGKEM